MRIENVTINNSAFAKQRKIHRFRYDIKAASRSHVICSRDRQQNARCKIQGTDARHSTPSPLYSKCATCVIITEALSIIHASRIFKNGRQIMWRLSHARDRYVSWCGGWYARRKTARLVMVGIIILLLGLLWLYDNGLICFSLVQWINQDQGVQLFYMVVVFSYFTCNSCISYSYLTINIRYVLVCLCENDFYPFLDDFNIKNYRNSWNERKNTSKPLLCSAAILEYVPELNKLIH